VPNKLLYDFELVRGRLVGLQVQMLQAIGTQHGVVESNVKTSCSFFTELYSQT